MKKLHHAGVTNDQLMACAACDYRLEYEILSQENKTLRREVKAAWACVVGLIVIHALFIIAF